MLVGYVLTKVSVTVYAGGVMLQGLMGLDFWTGAAAVVVLTGVYTVLGGLRTVVYTEVLQAFVLVGGSAAVTVFGLAEIFLFIVPGMIALGLANRDRLDLTEADQALPVLVNAVLPVGLRGLVAAGLLAALMSSLAAVFNSCSTLFTMDVYRKLRPAASGAELVRVGRLGTLAVVGLGIAWIPVMQVLATGLYTYLQNVQAYIAPPIAAVFLLGLLWNQVNATGAICTLVAGFVLGMAKLLLELRADALSGPLGWLAGVNFLYFGFALSVVCVLLLCAVSLATERPDPARLTGLTFGAPPPDDPRRERTWTTGDLVQSAAIVLLVTAVLVYFS